MANVLKFDSEEALGDILVRKIIEIVDNSPSSSAEFSVAMSGGSLTKIFEAAIVDGNIKSKLETSNWRVYFADERFVPLDNQDSNFFACTELFKKLGISSDRIEAIDLDADDLKSCAEEYGNRLKSKLHLNSEGVPVFDLVLLGMGPDGHTASLFPDHDLLTSEKVVDFIADSPKLPKERITLTLRTINAAKNVFFVAFGDEKADVLSQILKPERDRKHPASLVEAKSITWLVSSFRN